jgi:hypothetical protein
MKNPYLVDSEYSFIHVSLLQDIMIIHFSNPSAFEEQFK